MKEDLNFLSTEQMAEIFEAKLPGLIRESTWGKKPATWKQKHKLKGYGVSLPTSLLRGDAFLLIRNAVRGKHVQKN